MLRDYVYDGRMLLLSFLAQLAQRLSRPRGSIVVRKKPTVKRNQVHLWSIDRQVVWPLRVMRQELTEIQLQRKQDPGHVRFSVLCYVCREQDSNQHLRGLTGDPIVRLPRYFLSRLFQRVFLRQHGLVTGTMR